MAMHDETFFDDPASLHLLLDFLIHWLVYHILGMGQNMARQIIAIKNGSSARKALQMSGNEVHYATETLLEALNNLFQQLSDRNKELHQLNRTLELKVKQRTQELQEANQHLEQLALTDVLTGLPNRRYAMSCLSELWEKAQQQGPPLSCLMIDADYFKEVNDKYGHDAGDKVLIELAQELQQTLRNDDIVCRLGGDEFMVICENTDFAGAKHLAGLLCRNIAEFKVEVAGGSWLGSVSIGR
jgi:diguanylate cyclase (GGDEF)-like protein